MNVQLSSVCDYVLLFRRIRYISRCLINYYYEQYWIWTPSRTEQNRIIGLLLGGSGEETWSPNGQEHDVQSHRHARQVLWSLLRNSPYPNPIYKGGGRWPPTQRGGAAFGRAISFVVSFALALNRVNVVAMTTILVLHVGVIGHHVPSHYDFMPPVISDLL